MVCNIAILLNITNFWFLSKSDSEVSLSGYHAKYSSKKIICKKAEPIAPSNYQNINTSAHLHITTC